MLQPCLRQQICLVQQTHLPQQCLLLMDNQPQCPLQQVLGTNHILFKMEALACHPQPQVLPTAQLPQHLLPHKATKLRQAWPLLRALECSHLSQQHLAYSNQGLQEDGARWAGTYHPINLQSTHLWLVLHHTIGARCPLRLLVSLECACNCRVENCCLSILVVSLQRCIFVHLQKLGEERLV